MHLVVYNQKQVIYRFFLYDLPGCLYLQNNIKLWNY
jgi:hypothetical protein